MKHKLGRLVVWLQVRIEIGKREEAAEAMSVLTKMEELGIIRRVYGTKSEWKVIE